jgi:hypothetical protein
VRPEWGLRISSGAADLNTAFPDRLVALLQASGNQKEIL